MANGYGAFSGRGTLGGTSGGFGAFGGRGILGGPVSRTSIADRRRQRQQELISGALLPFRQLGLNLETIGFQMRAKQQQDRIAQALDFRAGADIRDADEVIHSAKEGIGRVRSQYATMLTKKYGIDPRQAKMAADVTILPEKQRSLLTGSGSLLAPIEMAANILSVPGNVLGNTLLGVRHGWQGESSGWQEAWDQFKGAGEGFTKNPWGSHSLERYYSELAAAPGAPAFLKNRVVQFGALMLTDPVNFLSFGAVPASKLLASRMLAKSFTEVSASATKMLAGDARSKLIRESGLIYGGKGKDGNALLYLPGSSKRLEHEDLVEFLTDHWNQPRTLGEAMGILREQELARKSSELWQPISQFKTRRAPGGVGSPGVLRSSLTSLPRRMLGLKPIVPGEAGQPLVGALAGTGFRMATGALMPRNVLGGAGVRFAGREIPGTAKLGAMASQALRSKLGVSTRVGQAGKEMKEFGLEEVIGTKGLVAKTLLRGLSPRWQLKLIADDRLRALSMMKWDNYRWAQAELQPQVAKRIQQLTGMARDAELIPQEQRVGIHRMPLSDIADDNLRKLWIGVKNVRTEGTHRALGAGATDKEVQELWDDVVARHNDPLGAAAEFAWRTEARAAKEDFINDILHDPSFAKPWIKPDKEGNLPSGHLDIWKHYGDETTLPAEYVPFGHRGKNFIVKRAIADSLTELKNPAFIDNELGKVMKMLQTPQNFWKTFATVPNPSFHVMNFLGAVWNNLASGVYNPADYLESFAVLWNARLASYAEQGRKHIRMPFGEGGVQSPWGVPAGSPIQKAALETFESAAQRGGLGRESIFQELVAGQTAARMPGELTTRQRAKEVIIPHPEESKKRYVGRQARRGLAVASAATGNPFGAVIMMAPEIAGVGRQVGTTIENAVRLAPFIKTGKRSSVWQALDAMGPPRVPGFDYSVYTKANREAMRDAAATISTKFQFDYGDLTPFERKWAKFFFPFWVFHKNNIMLQTGWLANRPRYVYGVQAMQNFIEEQWTPDLEPMKDILPAYFDKLDAFEIPVPESIRRGLGMNLTQPVYLNPKLPYVGLNMLPPLWDVARSDATTPERMSMILQPIFGQWGSWGGPFPGAKLLLESFTNWNLGLNQRIDYTRANSNDASQAWKPAPKWVEYLPGPVKDFLGAIPGEIVLPDYPFDPENLVYNKQSKKWMMPATSIYIAEAISTPFLDNLGKSALYTEPGATGDKGKADLISWLSGVRLMPVDIPKLTEGTVYDQIAMLEGEKDRLGSMGFGRRGRPARLPIQDERTLRMLRKYAAIFQKLDARRERETGG